MNTPNPSLIVEMETERQVILSGPQERALEWLMNGGSVTEAAEFAGVSRQTVSKWLNQDADFRAIYEAWREQALSMAEGQLVGAVEAAASAVSEAIRNRRDTRAAQFLLKQLRVGERRK